MALVIKFIRMLQHRVKQTKNIRDENCLNESLIIDDEYIAAAENYYFKIATSEVKYFLTAKQYKTFLIL